MERMQKRSHLFLLATLPDSTGADWFLVFWSKCVERTKLGSLPALLRIKKGPILESPYTRSALVARMMGEKLTIIGDDTVKSG